MGHPLVILAGQGSAHPKRVVAHLALGAAGLDLAASPEEPRAAVDLLTERGKSVLNAGPSDQEFPQSFSVSEERPP